MTPKQAWTLTEGAAQQLDDVLSNNAEIDESAVKLLKSARRAARKAAAEIAVSIVRNAD